MARSLSFASMMTVLAVSLAVTACSSDFLDTIGQEKKTPLVGTRKALFPQGVPGVEFGAPPTQPSNSNIAISPNMGVTGDQPQQQAKEEQDGDSKQKKQQSARAQKAQAQEEARQAKMARDQERRAAQQDEKSARTASRQKKSADEDPWSETR